MPRRPSKEQERLFEPNLLYYGDNLRVLREYVQEETVDLIYLDPPFKSGQNYNLLFTEREGRRVESQEKAFYDTWHWNPAAWESYQQTVRKAGAVSEALQAFKKLVGTSDMLAYLSMMAPRLVELRKALRKSGSIYLHCDPTASHYLKLLMDAVFGPKCFRNEIIWSYRRWPSPAKHFQRMHDVILFYVKDPKAGPGTFNVEYEANSPSYVKRFKGKTQMLDPNTKTRKITSDKESKGLPRRDVWELSIIAGSKKERVGFPTQKPESLLTRIIEASTKKGGLVLDPFCGCGTTVTVAQKLERRWIGIDITKVAIEVIQERLLRDYGEEIKSEYEVRPEPASVQDAHKLADEDKHSFQDWALRRIGAYSAPHKRGADKGIDGRMYYFDHIDGETKLIVVSVKGGNTGPAHVRDLRGVMEREKASLGVFVTRRKPTVGMKEEAAEAGTYYSDGLRRMVSRLQILTVEDLFEGKVVDFPAEAVPMPGAPGKPEPADEEVREFARSRRPSKRSAQTSEEKT